MVRLAGILALALWTWSCSAEAAPEPGTPALAAPAAPQEAKKSHDTPLRIFIRGGVKTHGPGEHDHPAFLKDWTVLLKERGCTVDGFGLLTPGTEAGPVTVRVGDGTNFDEVTVTITAPAPAPAPAKPGATPTSGAEESPAPAPSPSENPIPAAQPATEP